MDELKEEISTIFLDTSAYELVCSTKHLDVYQCGNDVGCEYLYNNGIRAGEFGRDNSRYIYNTKNGTLTEDRSLSGGVYTLDNFWRMCISQLIKHDHVEALEMLLSDEAYAVLDVDKERVSYYERTIALDSFDSSEWCKLYDFSKEVKLGSRWLTEIITNTPLTHLDMEDMKASDESNANFEYAVKYVKNVLGVESRYQLFTTNSTKWSQSGYIIAPDYDTHKNTKVFILEESLGTRSQAFHVVLMASLENFWYEVADSRSAKEKAFDLILNKLDPSVKEYDDAKDADDTGDLFSDLDEPVGSVRA